MNAISSILLGIVQGLTEFLPVSSSGHLVFFQHLLGAREPELLLDISLHLGTLLAVCYYFRSDLKRMILETWHFATGYPKGGSKDIQDSPNAALVLYVIIGTIPTGIIGFLFKDPLEQLFASVNTVGVMLICTGLIVGSTMLISTAYARRQRVGVVTAVAVGIAQGIAIIPGISRSGATIVCGMLFGLRGNIAARFSFILSIPAIIGALMLQLLSEGSSRTDIFSLAAGFISSALVGLLALKILMAIVKKGRLAYFAPYCWAVGLFILFM